MSQTGQNDNSQHSFSLRLTTPRLPMGRDNLVEKNTMFCIYFMETWAGKHRLGAKYVTVFKYLWPEKVSNSCIRILEMFIRFDNISMPS